TSGDRDESNSNKAVYEGAPRVLLGTPAVWWCAHLRKGLSLNCLGRGNRIASPVISRDETMNHDPSATATSLSIGQYLIRRLQEYGIRDLFGIPGDYVLSFYSMLEKSPIRVIGCTREDCAGFAADAYARINGMGALCVTYCVGGLSVCNSIAGAYAEKSPVVVISGAPGLKERINNPLLHHKVRDFRTQHDVFDELCVAPTESSDPVTAFREIDRVLPAA